MTAKSSRTRPIRTSDPVVKDKAKPEFIYSLPGLRGALWMLFAAMLISILVVIGLQENIEVLVLRLIAASIAALGVIGLTLFNRIPIGSIVGVRSGVVGVIMGVLIGAAMWIPINWTLLIVELVLSAVIGSLTPPAPLATSATRVGAVFQLGVIIPLAQGLLLFGLIQHSAQTTRGFTRWGAVLFTAFCFAILSLVTTEYGLAAILPFFLLGVAAGALTLWTGSIWPGAAVIGGYQLVRALTEDSAFQLQFLGFVVGNSDQSINSVLFGARYLLLVFVGSFIAFVLLQIARAVLRRSGAIPMVQQQPVRRLTFIPAVLIGLLLLAVGYGELQLRVLGTGYIPSGSQIDNPVTEPPMVVTPITTPVPVQ